MLFILTIKQLLVLTSFPIILLIILSRSSSYGRTLIFANYYFGAFIRKPYIPSKILKSKENISYNITNLQKKQNTTLQKIGLFDPLTPLMFTLGYVRLSSLPQGLYVEKKTS